MPFYFLGTGKSNTAALIVYIPVLMVGSGKGVKLLEWSLGNPLPVCLLSTKLTFVIY